MNIPIVSNDQLLKIKEIIDNELDVLQDRLQHFNSSVIPSVTLKTSYRINALNDGFEIDTSIDASLVFLIKQTIRLCINKHFTTAN